jgi:hypothetical protein
LTELARSTGMEALALAGLKAELLIMSGVARI